MRLEGSETQTLTLGAAEFNRLELAAPAVSVIGDLAAEELVIGDGTQAFVCTFEEGAVVSVMTLAALGDPTAISGTLRCSAENGQWKLVAYQTTVVGTAVSGSDASDSETELAVRRQPDALERHGLVGRRTDAREGRGRRHRRDARRQ